MTGLVLALVLLITLFLNVHTSYRNVFTKFVNIFLSLCLIGASVLLPYELDKVGALFDAVVGEKAVVNVYRMSNAYMSAHQFSNIYQYEMDRDRAVLSSLREAEFITSLSADRENAQYGLAQLKDAFNDNVSYTDYDNLMEAADALYNHKGDFLIMGEADESVLEDMGYDTFSLDTVKVASFTRNVTSRIVSQASLTEQPFTIFIGGNDEEGQLSLEGRTDVDMLVSVNPKSHQAAIISMPRDAYIPNPYYGGKKDKLTHFGLKGIDNTLEGLGDYLDVKIDNYVIVNFTTYMNIINAVGGVDVDNPYEFTYTYEPYDTFPEGQVHLEGYAALEYVRERKSLDDGDFGRAYHQQLVMKALINKITSPQGIVHFNDILDSINGNIMTNLSSDAIYGLAQKQLSQKISWNLVNYHVIGDSDMAEPASMPGQYASVVYPYDNQVEFCRHVIDQVEAGDILTQEETPEGEYYENKKEIN